MKIAILGSRGIPNHYGGFEQLAEYLSQGLVRFGHEVIVYNSHTHPYQKNSYNGVHIIHKYDPEYLIGSAGQFVYDLLCTLDARKRSFDIILKLGYGTNFMWDWLIRRKAVIICNLDGLEWKRDRYNKIVQLFLKIGEYFAVRNTEYLVTDSMHMHDYIEQRYKVSSYHISYGAFIFEHPNSALLNNFQLKVNGYDMLVARFVPENNIEMILQGVLESKINRKFLVIGNHATRYGKYLVQKFRNPDIIFLGGIYDQNLLNNLRYFSNLYFHGHSVGGTNPSLLEAMASQSLICAFDTVFNRAILGNEAYYFSNVEDLKLCFLHLKTDPVEHKKIEMNLKKIAQHHSWNDIVLRYDKIFQTITGEKK